MRSCCILRYLTLNATTSKCIVLNRYSRNYSTPNLKIVSGQGGSLRCIFCVISKVARPVPKGPNWVTRRWRWKGSRNRLPDVGASVSLARLTNAGIGNRAKFGYPTLARLLPGRWEALAKRMRQSLSSGHSLPEASCVRKISSSRRKVPEEIVVWKNISRILLVLETSWFSKIISSRVILDHSSGCCVLLQTFFCIHSASWISLKEAVSFQTWYTSENLFLVIVRA
jgi:hypothetical protein